MKNIGNSILPSSCPEILRLIKFNGGTLKVKPDEARDTHDLWFSETILASHPNGYSCHSLGKRIIAGDAEQIANQAAYIEQCGGTANWEAIFKLPGLNAAALKEAHKKCNREFSEHTARLNESLCRVAKERGMNAGLTDAKLHNQDPRDFEPMENPYGVETEAELFQAWAEGYENTFEASKGKL